MKVIAKYLAAFRSPKSNRVFVGATHGDAFAASDVRSILEVTEAQLLRAEGFARPDGSGFMSRARARRRLGFACSEDMG